MTTDTLLQSLKALISSPKLRAESKPQGWYLDGMKSRRNDGLPRGFAGAKMMRKAAKGQLTLRGRC